MNEALPENPIATSLIDSFGSYTELVTTLSIATFAGVFAFLFRIMEMRVKGEATVELRYQWLIWLSLLLVGVSIVFSYFSKGAIIGATPEIFHQQFQNKNLAEQLSIALDVVRMMQLVQVLSLFGSLVLLAIMIFLNRHLLHASPPASGPGSNS